MRPGAAANEDPEGQDIMITTEEAALIRRAIRFARANHTVATALADLTHGYEKRDAGDLVLAALNPGPLPVLALKAYQHTLKRLPLITVHHRNCHCAAMMRGGVPDPQDPR